MANEVSIRFGKSSSQNYLKAIKYCKNFINFTAISDDSPYNVVSLDHDELMLKSQKVERLWTLISGWKQSSIYMGEKETSYSDFREILNIIHCSEACGKAVLPEKHCINTYSDAGWNCRHISIVRGETPDKYSFEYDRFKYWFQFGCFESDRVWKIDKKAIKDALRREIDSKRINYCSHFLWSQAEDKINKLPDQIDLDESDLWEIHYETDNDGASLEKRPIGVCPKGISSLVNRDNYYESATSIRIGIGDEESEDEIRERYIPDVSFSDIGGIDDIIQTIREIIELPLKSPALFDHLGVTPHRGVLLFGEPGCGKTLIAKAIANEIGAHFISVKGPELLSKWHGQSEENFRKIFEEARDLEPAIIYFDEIDSVAQARSGEETLRFDSRIVNQLLTLMDGIEDYGNVCVLASTNRKELLDTALLRPGRFDYTIEVQRPTRQGCRDIFSIHTKKMPLSPKFSLADFATKLEGLSGAEIAFVAREGAYNCLRRSFDIASMIQAEELDSSAYGELEVDTEDFELALSRLKD